jgi:hypothetical protein
MVGWRTRIVLPAASVAYLLVGGVLREYGWFHHTGIAPLYAMWALCCTPCADAWSFDKLRAGSTAAAMQRRRRHDRPNCSTARHGWGIHAVMVVMASIYFSAGLSKLRNGGMGWLAADNMRSILYADNLNPMPYDFGAIAWLPDLPDAAFSLVAAAGLVVELAFPLAVYFRSARWVMPLLALAMHGGIWVLQNLLFRDLVLLNVGLVAAALVQRRSEGRRAAPETPPAGAMTSDDAAPFEHVGEARGLASGRPWALPAIAAACSLFFTWTRCEFYPFTAWQMYSSSDRAGLVVYHKVWAVGADGRVLPARLEHAIPALADTRYRAFLPMAFSDDEHQQRRLAEVFERAATRLNAGRVPANAIRGWVVERWSWDFRAEGTDPLHGHCVARRSFPVAENSTAVAAGAQSIPR